MRTDWRWTKFEQELTNPSTGITNIAVTYKLEKDIDKIMDIMNKVKNTSLKLPSCKYNFIDKPPRNVVKQRLSDNAKKLLDLEMDKPDPSGFWFEFDISKIDFSHCGGSFVDKLKKQKIQYHYCGNECEIIWSNDHIVIFKSEKELESEFVICLDMCSCSTITEDDKTKYIIAIHTDKWDIIDDYAFVLLKSAQEVEFRDERINELNLIQEESTYLEELLLEY